jgi:hypothetical protein
MILIIDNYDSFTYNLVQYVGELGGEISVFRNDSITADEVEKIKPIINLTHNNFVDHNSLSCQGRKKLLNRQRFKM